MKADREQLEEMEPLICDISDMADVIVVVLNHHRTQALSVSGTDMTAEQAVKALDHTAKLVDFCEYQLNALVVSLRHQYFGMQWSTTYHAGFCINREFIGIPFASDMKRVAFDRRPGIEPSAPPPRQNCFSSPPKPVFFDVKTTAFLVLSAWLIFYLADRAFIGGAGYTAVTDALSWATRRF